MNREEKVSIIIPVYNAEAFIEETINSVLAGTFQNYELILVDDASKDRTGEICDHFARNYANIKVIHHDVNQGLSESREDGFRTARNEWISFIDHDDKISPQMYECLMESIEDADIVCVRGEERNLNEFDNIIWGNIDENELRTLNGKEACKLIYAKQANFGIITPLWGKCYRKAFLESILEQALKYKNMLKWTYFEDVFLGPQLFYYAEKVVINNVFMYAHRHMATNLSSSLKPTLFHYETVGAGRLVLHFWKKEKMDFVFDNSVMGYLLMVQRAWYQTVEYETNEETKKIREKEIVQAFNEFYPNIQKMHYKKMNEKIKKITMYLFDKNRNIWKYLVGHFWFRVIYCIKYRIRS